MCGVCVVCVCVCECVCVHQYVCVCVQIHSNNSLHVKIVELLDIVVIVNLVV